MLQIRSLQKSFDGFQAVKDANLSVNPGEVVAVIGPNGAGKTTLFNLVSGQIRPDAGSILFKGEDIRGLPSHKLCHRGMSRSFQIVKIFSRMSVFENVQTAVISRIGKTANLFTPARNIAVKETLTILEAMGLSDKRDRICGLLSHGDQKVLEMAISLGSDPQLLILDEPTAGMSGEETATTIDLMKRLSSERGLTILFCEHDVELVFSFSDRIMVMQQGSTITQGTPDQVRNDPQVKKAYLGGQN
ncbi:ABC transporter ATP-binding protein [Geopsychrobacter electrodiphilus]|uniref:ABC transporter ATP-binding protein n=1 Tax=Geopsychrobacter electrodiphilus TaxID=225196 RepID=UPI00036717DB|nr:ABC transporter ATP-binding protein [Geopsychrobacter electrodiphilus]